MLPNLEIKQALSAKGYELESKIGEGGFGSVYKAKHLNTEQSVAIKFLQLDTGINEQKRQREIARFDRESQFVGQFSHPNIVRLLDKGNVATSCIYSVFEYVKGTPLNEYLHTYGTLDVESTRSIMLQVLDALVHAHQCGVIHRDIKPSNIMLSHNGAKLHAKLLDFGISTQAFENRSSSYQTLTLDQETLGTPTYCAPEQLRGEAVTFSSDLYMWGLVFIECLTGSPAVKGGGIAETYHQHLSEAPIPVPKELLAHPLGDLLRHVLQKRVNERTVSAEETYNRLDAMVVSNLVGHIHANPIQNNEPSEEVTVALRQDDSAHLPTHYGNSAHKKQISSLALRINAESVEGNTEHADVVEAVFQSTRNQCIDIAKRYGGFHVGNLGNLSLFYFGYPVASDNDARFAARTALEIISLANKQDSYIQQQYGYRFLFHLAIHCDQYLVRQNQVPDGLSNHIVTELVYKAKDKSILCSRDSETLLQPFYHFEETATSPEYIDHVALKSERTLESFGFIRGTRHQRDIIGRKWELNQLEALTLNPNIPAIYLQGEAGIGKSRLVHELQQNKPHLIFQCLPEHQSNALLPILAFLKHTLFKSGKSNDQKLIELIEHSELAGSKDDIIALLLAWLSLDTSEKKTLSNIDQSVQRGLLFEGLLCLLQQSNPDATLYVIEDTHWADPMTLEFIHYLISQNTGTDKTLLMTSRSLLQECLEECDITSIQLAPLHSSDTHKFISTLFDGTPVSEEVNQVLLTRTDGVPLFIEELVQTLKKHELTHVIEGKISFKDTEKTHQIPLTLRESIQNKIDGLTYAKDTLQLAATLGREFDHQLLTEVSLLSRLQVQHDLEVLLENQIIIQQMSVDGDRYLFKHALIQEVSYDTIPTQTRSDMHLQVATCMESLFENPDRLVSHNIAQHFNQAEKHFKASWWYEKAADDASAIYAVEDAIKLYQSALPLCLSCNETHEQAQLKVRILEGYASNLVLDGQHPEARQIFEDLASEYQLSNNHLALAKTQLAHGKTHEVVHEHKQALSYYQKASCTLDLVEHTPEPTQSDWWQTWLQINNAELNVQYWLGKPDHIQAIHIKVEPVVLALADHHQLATHYDNLLLFYLREQQYVLNESQLDVALKGIEAAKLSGNKSLIANALFTKGFCLCHIQKVQPALDYLEEALSYAETLNDKVLQTRCYTYLTVVYRLKGDIKNTRKYANVSLKLSENVSMNDYIAAALANLSWCYLKEQEKDLAISHLIQSLNKWEDLSSRYPFPFLWLSHLHALTLYQIDKGFAEEYIPDVSAFATRLLDKNQAWLTQEIKHCLENLSCSRGDNQKRYLLELSNISQSQKFV
ncbi:protein kinase domain-containing protein [Vibrio nigripulchritudo]|uniref:protein kinase domain-containing protein n=1 Tax=Vibrio nigripulchritudo TaxID=28173 RepID=UPI0003B18381|nr:protein kinase [Vibrio nigripulchritudo]CCN72245.1 putative Mitogen-activated protein kinase kinase kinase [Vibrio nigripulchritudo SFn118]